MTISWEPGSILPINRETKIKTIRYHIVPVGKP
ncbi:rCG63534 [Rattus norvegicus]|uniref:RCG63534 n=1 Tax=Rattus norvegicus TaxID=10116 RepID=A6JAF5_RAT|nr:rCG63534 [Rattus norvegicus]